MFEKIGRNASLKNQVAEYIKNLIKNGKLKPGDRLPTEREMAEKFGVSRTVIRDAVKTLSGVGILKVKHGLGIFVAKVDVDIIARQLSSLLFNESDTVDNLFEVRMELETVAAGWAAERCTEEARAKISQFTKESQALLNSNGESDSFQQYDQEFHLLVSEMTGNPVVVRLMRSMLDLLEEARSHTLHIPGRFDLSVQEHIKVLEAIYKGNTDRAKSAMHDHLLSVLNSIKESRDHQEI